VVVVLLLLLHPQPAAAAGLAAGLAAEVWVRQVGLTAEQQKHRQ
jgi:hypothetical protein